MVGSQVTEYKALWARAPSSKTERTKKTRRCLVFLDRWKQVFQTKQKHTHTHTNTHTHTHYTTRTTKTVLLKSVIYWLMYTIKQIYRAFTVRTLDICQTRFARGWAGAHNHLHVPSSHLCMRSGGLPKCSPNRVDGNGFQHNSALVSELMQEPYSHLNTRPMLCFAALGVILITRSTPEVGLFTVHTFHRHQKCCTPKNKLVC
jgi:hypothetical protein